MRTLEDIQARLKDAENSPGLVAEMGVEFVEIDIESGFIRAEMTPEAKHLNMGGGVHGGVLASLADVVAGLGVICSIPEEAWTTTTELNISYMRRMKKPPLSIEGRALHRGLRTQVWEVDIKDQAGRHMARARLRFMVSVAGRV